MADCSTEWESDAGEDGVRLKQAYGFLGSCFALFCIFFFLWFGFGDCIATKCAFSFVLISRLNGRTIISNLGSIYTMNTVVNLIMVSAQLPRLFVHTTALPVVLATIKFISSFLPGTARTKLRTFLFGKVLDKFR